MTLSERAFLTFSSGVQTFQVPIMKLLKGTPSLIIKTDACETG